MGFFPFAGNHRLVLDMVIKHKLVVKSFITFALSTLKISTTCMNKVCENVFCYITRSHLYNNIGVPSDNQITHCLIHVKTFRGVLMVISDKSRMCSFKGATSADHTLRSLWLYRCKHPIYSKKTTIKNTVFGQPLKTSPLKLTGVLKKHFL